MTTKAQWRKIREQVFEEQNHKCWDCPRVFSKHDDMQRHHAVYTDDKRFSKWLDKAENIVLVCHKCHEKHGWLSCYMRRCMVWTYKVNLGYDMKSWHDSIPMLIKDRFPPEYLPKKKD